MPIWKIHDKWAKEFQIPYDVSNFVNNVIDFPDKNIEYQNYIKKVVCKNNDKAFENLKKMINRGIMKRNIMGHDGAKHKTIITNFQLEFFEQYGDQYIQAFFLHHLLDIINDGIPDSKERSFAKFKEKISNEKYITIQHEIVHFVDEKYDLIFDDIKRMQ